MLQKSKNQITFAVVSIYILFSSNAHTSFYQQINFEILKKINLDDPLEKDLPLITACQLTNTHGTPTPAISNTTLEALTSVDLISEILPRFKQTHTTFGYLSLIQQLTNFTTNMQELQTKTDRLKFLDSHEDIFTQLDTIIKHSTSAEHAYLALSSNHITEEATNNEKTINSKLYFQYLSNLNENRFALEIGPRLNQLHTLAWYIIPLLLTSVEHKCYKQSLQQKDLDKKKQSLSSLRSCNNKEKIDELEKEITILEDAIKNDPSILEKTYRDITPANIKESDIQKVQKDLEMLITQILEENKKEASWHFNYYKSEIAKAKNILSQNSSTQPLDAYIEITTCIVNLKDLFKKNTALEDFLQKLFISIYPHLLKNSHLRYNPLGMLNHLIKNTAITSISNLPSLICDAVSNIPTGISKGWDGICYMYNENPVYNNIKKDLVNFNGYDNDATQTKIIASLHTGGIYALIAASIGFYPYMLYSRYHSTKDLLNLIYDKQKDVVHIAHLIKSMQKIYKIIKHDSLLKRIMPEYKTLAYLFDNRSKKTSNDLKNLISLLLSSSFQHGNSYYFSQQGKILATHHLLMRIKEQLVPYLQAYGHIDAYLSVYKWYKQFQNHPRARICLPHFIEQERPQMIVKDFWHPLINAQNVITNNLSIGTSEQNSNLIITGPNAGGKTTTLMSLIINTILAQTYGISMASQFTLTPFHKIHSYLDITTNLLEGESLFKAEVNRSKRLKESILSCKAGEKAFTIIDEIFSGTNPDVASKVGFTFADQIGKISHSMTIITTHFPRLTDLEKETGHYSNYKVADAHIAQDGTITYPFKLECGASTQNIAEHMLTTEGII